MTKNIYYFEWLRALSIIAVINIHVVPPTLQLFNFSKFSFLIGSILALIPRSAVPIFFMISGALLLDKVEDKTIFFKKRVNKMLIPSLFWAIFYSVWINKDNLNIVDLKLIVMKIYTGDIYYHYWFIYTILGLYLVTPIIRLFTLNASRRDIEYLLLVWLLGTAVDMTIYKIFKIHLGINLQYVGGFLGYFILGYYLYKYEISKTVRNTLYLLSVPIFLAAVFSTYQLTKIDNGNIDLFFYDYFNPITVLFSIVIFLLFKNSKISSENKIIKLISNASFGIYLIHPIIIELLDSNKFKKVFGFVIDHTLINTFMGVFITDVCVLSISLGIIWWIKRIPIVKNIV